MKIWQKCGVTFLNTDVLFNIILLLSSRILLIVEYLIGITTDLYFYFTSNSVLSSFKQFPFSQTAQLSISKVSRCSYYPIAGFKCNHSFQRKPFILITLLYEICWPRLKANLTYKFLYGQQKDKADIRGFLYPTISMTPTSPHPSSLKALWCCL